MAKSAADHQHGDMDIAAHEASFHAFILMAKWGSLAVASAVLFLTLWFCTGTGFLGAFLTGFVVAVLGILLLRDKAGAGAH
jgi:hypothetical protein